MLMCSMAALQSETGCSAPVGKPEDDINTRALRSGADV